MFALSKHLWLVLMPALACGIAQAQLTNCKDPGPPEPFKIYVDEVRLSSVPTPSNQIQGKLDSIRQFLSTNLRVSSKNKASVRDCGKRFPTDPADFDRTEFDSLKRLHVVLEVWGILENPAGGNARIGFALVQATDLADPPVFEIPSPDLLTNLRQGKQMTAFAPLVLGIRHYHDEQYDEAATFLCDGTQQLNAMLTGPRALGDAAFRTQQRQLLTKIKVIMDDSIAKAGNIPGSNVASAKAANGGTFPCSAN